VSIQVPVLTGTGSTAQAKEADIDSIRLREQIKSARGRISLDARRSFEELQRVEGDEQIARLDLEVTRKQLSLTLAQFGEGRTTLAEVANLRMQENEKWIGFFEVQNARERARLNVLRQTGSLLAALR
jgi:outer membrane protein TolC